MDRDDNSLGIMLPMLWMLYGVAVGAALIGAIWWAHAA